MTNAVSSITRAATRKFSEPLNILTFPTHERYETSLAKTGHNFYAYRADGIKDWNSTHAPVPDNYYLLNKDLGENQIPLDLDFDLVLSQNKFGQFQIAYPLSQSLHLPLVSLEHTLPVPYWSDDVKEQTRHMRGDANVFISNYSIEDWKWDIKNDTTVITHGVDSDLFQFNDSTDRENQVLSVVNDWINRDWCCGFSIWQNIINGLPFQVVGDTPGLSEVAKSTEDLVKVYQSNRIFLNTSTISPVPTALLEAMACGCAVVTTATCMIPEIIENGVNGFISNDETELKQYLVDLLNDEDLAKNLGREARKTIVENFSQEKFVLKWDSLLHRAAKFCFRG
tara:strand:- start:415 stop:1431 length:1017 start_codon:yes stop_codon:yes gene_type:complete